MSSPDSTELWHFAYWYPSNDHNGKDVSEYDVACHDTGSALVFESVPTADGSYIFSRLTKNDDIYSGTWYESTAPKGPFGGAQYSGAGQLLMNEDGTELTGMWAGAGFDHDTKKMRIYDGAWKITKLGETDGK